MLKLKSGKPEDACGLARGCISAAHFSTHFVQFMEPIWSVKLESSNLMMHATSRVSAQVLAHLLTCPVQATMQATQNSVHVRHFYYDNQVVLPRNYSTMHSQTR